MKHSYSEETLSSRKKLLTILSLYQGLGFASLFGIALGLINTFSTELFLSFRGWELVGVFWLAFSPSRYIRDMHQHVEDLGHWLDDASAADIKLKLKLSTSIGLGLFAVFLCQTAINHNSPQMEERPVHALFSYCDAAAEKAPEKYAEYLGIKQAQRTKQEERAPIRDYLSLALVLLPLLLLALSFAAINKFSSPPHNNPRIGLLVSLTGVILVYGLFSYSFFSGLDHSHSSSDLFRVCLDLIY